jgi:tetratricopeptide (TPR) repeat protein
MRPRIKSGGAVQPPEMRLMANPAPALLLLLSGLVFAQSAPPQPPATGKQAPAATKPGKESAQPARKVDRAAAYYHYTLAHIYEELVSMHGRSEFATKAIEQYRLAIQNDPDSEYLNAGLAELYAKTGRIRDAVVEAQDILKRDPSNLEAHKLLGRIYLRSLGDMQQGTQSQEILKLAIEQFEHIVRLQPRSVDDHLLLGRLYRLNNELLKAENEFKIAIKLAPDSEEALTSLAYLYDEEGDSAKAIELLNSVPDSARSSRLYSALGYTYEQKKDHKKAIEAYRRAIELDRDNLDSVRGLAQNLLSDGQLDAALEQYKSITEADPQDAQAHLRTAEINRRLGKFGVALESLKKAGTLVQDTLEVPYNIALVYEVEGRYDEAAQIIQGLLKKGEKADGTYNAGERNNRAVFLERLGTIYREMGKPQQAVETFRRILQLGDDNAVRGYQQIVDTYREQKQWQQATTAAQEAVNKFPNDRQLKLLLASQHAENGRGDAAVSEIKALLKGTPEDREIYIALAQIQTRLRHWKEAEEAVAQAEKLSTKPEEKDYVAFISGSVYERQKKYDQAEEQFKRVLAGDPHNGMALNYLGYMLADRGVRLDEALGYIKKATAQDPQNGAYLDSLGWAYYRMGNYVLAEENLRKASLKIPNDGTIQDHLGDVYFKTGRLKLAAAHWERALNEWGKTPLPGDVDTTDVARVQKKLESAKVKLAKQSREQAAGKE